MGALRRRLAAAAIVVILGAMSGCSGIGTIVDRTGLKAPDSPGERWHVALEMLGRGEDRQAEEIFVALRESAGYGERARHMLDQIRRPIHRYFPDDHFNVRLRAGQSLSALSRRYLDDPLKFFALARYNGIASPDRVAAGQLIRIPLTGHARRVRVKETGPPPADDPFDDSPGATDVPVTESRAQDGGESAAVDATTPDPGLSDAARKRIHRHYRKATIAFQRQDLDQTLRHCERVLALDADHENCLAYRDRARALQRQLESIERDGDAGD